ncbi:MAG: hypothetical protein RI907_57 [Pseudomonadota bacterium]|jgi:hypothetical protein
MKWQERLKRWAGRWLGRSASGGRALPPTPGHAAPPAAPLNLVPSAPDPVAAAAALLAQGGGLAPAEGLHASGRKIGHMIDEVDGIAFQAHLLALNTAIEATRDGDRPAAMGLVAGEVRSLVRRSADAAREVKSLVSDGQAQPEPAQAHIREIVDTIQHLSELIAEISVATGARPYNGPERRRGSRLHARQQSPDASRNAGDAGRNEPPGPSGPHRPGDGR